MSRSRRTPPPVGPCRAGEVPLSVCDRIADTCRRSKRSQVCTEFYFAEKKGEIVWDAKEGAWILPAMKKRSMRTVEIKIRARYDSTGRPYLLERCPFCGGEMPSGATGDARSQQGEARPPA